MTEYFINHSISILVNRVFIGFAMRRSLLSMILTMKIVIYFKLFWYNDYAKYRILSLRKYLFQKNNGEAIYIKYGII